MDPVKNTEENKEKETPMTVQKNTVMAVLSYIGLLIIIPYLVARDDGFVRFHIQQGLLLVIAELVIWFVTSMIWILFPLMQVLNVIILVLAIIGIVNAVQGKEKELPFVGKYAKHLNIFNT